MKYPSFSELYAFLILKDLKELEGQKILKVLKEGENFYLIFKEKILKINLSNNFYRISVLLFKEIGGKKAVFSNLLENFKIEKVENKKGERIFIFNLSGISPLYEPIKRKFIIELLGRFKNLIITDENYNVIYDLKDKWKNKKYSFPKEKMNLFDIENSEWEDYVKKYFNEYFEIFGEKLKTLLKDLNPLNVKIFYLLYKEGKPLILSPWEIKGETENFENFSEGVEKLFNFYKEEKEEEKREMDKGIIKKIEFLEKKILKEGDYEKYKKMGELCILYKSELENKEGKFKLKDPEKNEEYEVEIKRDPLKAAQRYFEIYKNKKEKIEKILKKIEELKKRKEKGEIKKEKNFKEFISPSGFKIYVARNKEEANELTFHFAKPWDYFLHVKDYRGPHVILKRNKNQLVPDKDLFYAAKIAAEFSKRKGKIEVIYTNRENVKPLKGEKGKVKILSYKSLWINI
ncbi:MAG: NFACT RNA binding domain-containing protein [candidate division WOR-3 bacterium]